MLTAKEIRRRYLEFFARNGHDILPSGPLIPPNDPTLLFTNAGMVQFKKFFLGEEVRDVPRVTTSQKCLRVSGKHNDLENVGRTARHHTFFEMLGNFSFGDYFKREAITWAWKFVTEELELPKERLWVTVFREDDEAAAIWQEVAGLPAERIVRMGEKDNFWTMGDTGPCGPCSEIYIDQGEDMACGPDCGIGKCDCDRFLEIWNLVFTQFDQHADGTRDRLARPNIDTGMGLERIAAVCQGKRSNFDCDLFQDIIQYAAELAGVKYSFSAPDTNDVDTALRVIADHARAVDFMISDGILPGNEGREYVLRRLLRRAVFHGRLLGIEGAFLTKFIDAVNEIMGGAYPELLKNVALVKGIVSAEEERFSTTLDTGRAYLDEALDGLDAGTTLPGDVAFKLHDTYGFPIDLTVEIAQGAGHDVDMDAFDACMAEQKSRARAAANRDAWGDFNNVWTALSDELAPTEFDGYEHNELKDAKVVAIVADGERVSEAAEGSEVEVLLDRTPFYAEMGGQVGDTGTLVSEAAKLEVTDTKGHNGLYAHVAKVFEGKLHEGDVVTASIDAHRRELIRRNHTATHLLDAALKSVLGEHVNQAGSLVDDGRLRFDFTHFEALTAEQLHEVEDLVNVEIFSAKPVVTKVCGIEEAKAAGAVALFGEKYGDVVRMVSCGTEDVPFSRELCGGTHARNTSELGLFKIVSESSTGSNVRRIEAVTSLGALAWLDERNDALDAVAAELKCRPEDAAGRIADIKAGAREAEAKLKQALLGGSSDKIQAAMGAAIDCGSYKAVIARMDGLEAGELREAWDAIRDKANGGDVACFLATATPEGKVALLAAATDGAVKAGFGAGDVIRKVAEHVGGRGGGRPNMAQAGGKDAAGIEAALAAAREMLA